MSIKPTQFTPEELSVYNIMDQTPFCVPVFQRPYSWESSPVEQLWEDIVEFYIGERTENEKYFLGPIVTFTDLNSETDNLPFQIIDGQQRITTLKLLLHILFAKISTYDENAIMQQAMNNGDIHKGIELVQRIKPLKEKMMSCLWKCNCKDGRITNADWNTCLLQTNVIGAPDKENLAKIFTQISSQSYNEIEREICEGSYFQSDDDVTFTSKMNNRKDNIHQKNRALLFNLIKKDFNPGGKLSVIGQDEALFGIISVILEKCTLLSIHCHDQKSALKIFNTLNSRGQVLTTSDILKAQIYGQCNTEEDKSKFMEQWEELSFYANNFGFSLIKQDSAIDMIFRYYMHIFRAEQTADTTDPSMLEFYQTHEIKLCHLPYLIELAHFWQYVSHLTNPKYDNLIKDSKYYDKEEEYENSLFTENSKKFLQVLGYFRDNPYWRQLINIYLWLYRIKNTQDNFKEKFEIFLKQLTAYIIYAYLVPGDLKGRIYIQRHSFFETSAPYNGEYSWWKIPTDYNFDSLRPIIRSKTDNTGFASQLMRGFIALYTYLNPKQCFIQAAFDIEHVFSVNASKHALDMTMRQNYGMETQRQVDYFLQSLGNKIALEKEINVKASDGNFSWKKQVYAGHTAFKGKTLATDYKEAKYLSEAENDCWGASQIYQREQDVLNKIIQFLKEPSFDFDNWIALKYANVPTIDAEKLAAICPEEE